MLKSHLALGAAAAALLSTVASATVVLYNNFGPGDSYVTGSGWTVSIGAPTNSKWEPGFGFTVSGGDFFLTTLDLAMGHVTGVNSVTITLYSDGGGIPGAVLEQVTLGGFGPFGNFNPPAVATFSGNTVLADGQTYFLVATAVGPDAWLAWNQNDQGVGGRVWRLDDGPWNADGATSPAARVWGELVPAPGALALLGLAGLAGCRRRRGL